MWGPEKLQRGFRQTPVRIQVLYPYSDRKNFFVDLVQLGTSEKVPLVVSFIAAFVCGMILAYVRSWRLALALTSMIPCIAITGAVMNKFVAAYKQYVISSHSWRISY